MATANTINNDGIINLIEAMCEQAHEDLQPKSYTVNLTTKKGFKDSMNRYRTDKENAHTASQWLEYMKDVFVR